MVDACFLLDILIHFRSAYFDDELGQEISDSWKIAKLYLKGLFWLDLIAIFPFELMLPKDKDSFWADFIGLMKLSRILRINRLIQYLSYTEDTKANLRLLKILVFLALYLHLFGCSWWLIVSNERAWIPYMYA